MRGLNQDCWLIDNATIIHNYNNQRLMTDFTEKSTKVGGLIADGISLRRGIVWIKLALEDRSKKAILNL